MPYLQQPEGYTGIVRQHVAASPYNHMINGTLYDGQTGEIISTGHKTTSKNMPPPPTGGGGNAGGGGGYVDMNNTNSNPNSGGGTPPPPTGGGGMPPPPNSPWTPWGDSMEWGDMNIDPADYGSVQQFSDQAYQQSRRYLDPQQDMQNRRMDQELINRGIDPRSEMGREMASQLGMQHADQNNSAMFGALQFGQGIQDQMYNQMMGRSGMELARRAQDFNEMDAQQQMELARQVQDFNEMMGFDAIDYRNDVFNRDDSRWDQGIMMQFLGMQNPWAQGIGGNMPTGGYDNWVDLWKGIVNAGES